MTFVISKLFWIVAKPSNLIVLMLVVGFSFRRLAAGRVTFGVALISLTMVSVLPVWAWPLIALENRFERPTQLPDRIDGIIVLGGSQNPEVTAARSAIALSGEAERHIEGLALALRYPEAKLVFSGHSAAIFDDGLSEVQVNEMFVDMLQFPNDRVVMENRSRNTFENSLFTHDLIDPRDDENWILVTSAAHMPRAIGVFFAIGWHVIPWPVDYKTTGADIVLLDLAVGGSLNNLDRVAREWIGLAAYYLLGRTKRLFPGPS